MAVLHAYSPYTSPAYILQDSEDKRSKSRQGACHHTPLHKTLFLRVSPRLHSPERWFLCREKTEMNILRETHCLHHTVHRLLFHSHSHNSWNIVQKLHPDDSPLQFSHRKYLSHPEWFPAFLYVTLPLKSQQFLNNYAHYHLPVKQSYCKSNNFSDILIFSGPSDILLLIYYYFQIIYF